MRKITRLKGDKVEILNTYKLTKLKAFFRELPRSIVLKTVDLVTDWQVRVILGCSCSMEVRLIWHCNVLHSTYSKLLLMTLSFSVVSQC